MISKITTYFRDALSELRKVAWPTKKQTINYSLLVIGISIGMAIFLGILDYFFNLGLAQLIR